MSRMGSTSTSSTAASGRSCFAAACYHVIGRHLSNGFFLRERPLGSTGRRSVRPCDGSRGGGGGESGRGFGKDYRVQDEIRAQRVAQITATDMLAKLLQSGADAPAVAAQYVDSLTEDFFQIGSAYLQLADKEGDTAVATNLKDALIVAMEAKQATLRPEIQLLNRLLQAESAVQRLQVLNGKEAGAQLTMNDRYFFTLLERMTADVRHSPEGLQRGALLEKLADIKADALARLPPGAA